jgi:hypothetical protein
MSEHLSGSRWKVAGLRAVRVAAVSAAAFSLLTVEAAAFPKNVEANCKGDYLKYCPSYKENSPQLRACMTQAGKRGGLDPRCLNALVDAGMAPRKYRKY